jgi:ABC-type multidrug transport system ATPase subunit
VLLTTQYLEEADRLADNIVVIDDGQVIAEGTPAELKARMGSTVIDIGLGDERAASRAAGVITPFGVRPPRQNGRVLHLEVSDGARTLVQALRALDHEGLEPVELAVREPSLDDVFLALTGRRAHDGDAAGEVASDIRARGAA